MKKADYTPLIAVGALIAWAILREDPQCDWGCKNRLDHLLLHVLPLLFKRNFGPTDLIGLAELALPTGASEGILLGEAPYYPCGYWG